MDNNQIDYSDVRRSVEQGLKREKMMMRLITFVVNLIMFIVFSIIVVAVAAANPELGKAILEKNNPLGVLVALPMTGWLVSLIFHAVSLILETKVGERQMRDRVMVRELGKRMLGLTDDGEFYEKPKREQAMRLSDDGELVPDEQAVQVKQRVNRE